MATQKEETPEQKPAEPRGLGEHARGLVGENAHEQGWQLNEEQRRKQPAGKQNTDGGTDYDYGARDFGDEPVDMAAPITDEQVAKAREALTKGD